MLWASTLSAAQPQPIEEPWHRAGLSDVEAARHLLERLTYGPRPGEAEDLAASGIRRWIDTQFSLGAEASGWQPGTLAGLPYLDWSAEDLVTEFGARPTLRRQAVQRRLVEARDLDGTNGLMRQRDAEAVIERLAMTREMGSEEDPQAGRDWRPVSLMRHQRVARGIASEAQLHEVLTDFWFNHFNVSASKGTVNMHLVSYERDAIRPHLFGTFFDLLLATATHPAMLFYLDNATSRAAYEQVTTLDRAMRGERGGPLSNPTMRDWAAKMLRWRDPLLREALNPLDGDTGINENYARELLELHTLGVDGGYGPDDVVEVARVFTGWTYMPLHGGGRSKLLAVLEERELADELGFVRQEEFLFRPDWHDSAAKSVLGLQIDAGGGFDEGLRVLRELATHPSTADHLAYKLAQRFVSVAPPQALVQRVSGRFLQSGGDLSETMRALIESPEFWRRHPVPLRKSPLEFALSAVRALDGQAVAITSRRDAAIANSLGGLGHPLYAFDPPTGFPAVDGSWFSPGALLERVNLALRVAYAQIPEAEIDLRALGGEEPFATVDDALRHAMNLMLPQHTEESYERFRTALLAQTTPRPHWFRRALWLVLCSPEFQER